jgi:hypothetical protein
LAYLLSVRDADTEPCGTRRGKEVVVPHPSSARTRTLPARPSLVQLRKQAKELLTGYRSGEHAAVTEVERFERNPDPASFALSDAQRVLARAYGFASWAEFKQHVDGLNVRAFCEAADAGDVVRVRKAAKARPELVNIQREGEFGERNYVLMHATVPDSLKRILEHGVDPDVAGGGGYTMLHHLATDHVDEQTRVIRATMLLDAGASLNQRDTLLRSTPLGWACRWGCVDLVQLYLARGADAQEPDAEP